ncbi:LPS assembly protein LptD [Granulicella sp. dw_53]|uniref:LPS-assembly protein LptD n=1 Tax=Granulicella sp. dw_53 TaxID=2719792 RepID=UPI002103C040|nr:LPS assembly protein LptD [Granulicella sp. dw_53]
MTRYKKERNDTVHPGSCGLTPIRWIAEDRVKLLQVERTAGVKNRVWRISHLTRARRLLYSVYFFITITAVAVRHPQVWAQEVTNQATPQSSLPNEPSTASSSSDSEQYPIAQVLPGPDDSTKVVIESSGPQSKIGTKFILDNDVVITYGDRKVQADHVEYDTETGDLVATGHLKATGGKNNEIISASHGTMNVKQQTGRFFDVTGSVGLKQTGPKSKLVYANSNPFLFSGKMVVKTGPQEYEIYDGTVTSCLLPHPDWLLSSGKFVVNSEKATATNSIFKLLNIPLLYLPYVTHPVDEEGRQTGILLPVIGESSTKGLVIGEQVYWAINRSMDMTVGVEYFSRRGWAQSAAFRYKGVGNDFVTSRYSGLLDRGYVTGGMYVNQGGQDFTLTGRHDFVPDTGTNQTRVAADVEYLSSYPYREAFTENFNQAVSTDILSTAYGVHQVDGYSMDIRADRYQGLKRVPTATVTEQQVRIFHAPSIDLDTTDHALGMTGLRWSVEASAAGLKRAEPFFVSSGIVERLDVHPVLSYPFAAAGWHVRPSVALRDTFYSRSRLPFVLGAPQVESVSPINRSDVEVELDIRPPVIERTFTSGFVRNLLHRDFRHTIEPEFTYRYVSGIGNFQSLLRFDDIDVASDTNELEYGVTQRLFLRPGKKGPCNASIVPDDPSNARIKDDGDVVAPIKCGAREWISWRVTQKRFFDELFGGAVIRGRRNILDSTLNFSGIAFLTEPRAISPLVSRLRVRASEKVDVEWNFDLDTGAKKFTSNNVLVDVHEGNTFAGMSYARLNAPGRSYTQGIPSATSDFSQLRLLLGYGSPSKPGIGVAANAGLDLKQGMIQYAALQTSYNWNCCGLSIEYRKYELGSVRNENAYRFNFTLVNIGAAGNLRRAERLF